MNDDMHIVHEIDRLALPPRPPGGYLAEYRADRADRDDFARLLYLAWAEILNEHQQQT